MQEVIMDTNVAVVANGQPEQADLKCENICIQMLEDIIERRYILVDSDGAIFEEYARQFSYSGQPGPGDQFFTWLWRNLENTEHCRKIPVTPHAERGFEEFPDDPELASFDRDDRKFVAVALASGTTPDVLNASDTDWWDHRHALRRNGVRIIFLCEELMAGRS